MTNVDALARTLQAVIGGLRAARISPAASMTPFDVRSNAHGLSYAILASWWQRRSGAATWQEVYDEWLRRLPSPPTIDPGLFGCFDPADRFELLTDNSEAFAVRRRLFEGAHRSIDIATYYLQADETGTQTARHLAGCVRRGVKVRLLADGGAMARKIFERPALAGLIAELRGAGADFRLFHDRLRPYEASHRKLLIVDGETLVTGGRNFADHYSGPEWRDIDLLLTGPSVEAAQELFEQTFRAAGGYGAEANGSHGSIFHPTTPGALEANASFLFFLQCIRACRERLDIENAYYINHAVLFECLKDARGRGVRVRLLTNSAESNDLDFTNYRIYSGFPDLLAAGIELYVRRGKGRTLHCKYFVADGEWVEFGSSNLDYYSPRFCGEAGVQVRSRELGAALTGWFEEGLASADRLESAKEIDSVLENQPIGRIFDKWFPDIQ